jgi:hypothetical protein
MVSLRSLFCQHHFPSGELRILCGAFIFIALQLTVPITSIIGSPGREEKNGARKTVYAKSQPAKKPENKQWLETPVRSPQKRGPRWGWVTVNGREESHPEGTYTLEYRIGGRRERSTVVSVLDAMRDSAGPRD